jgi:hypothetical protein
MSTHSKPAQPGDYSHYYINLLALFGRTLPLPRIHELALAAVAGRQRVIGDFATRLAGLDQEFDRQRGARERADSCPPPRLQGLDPQRLAPPGAAGRGALIALFHYGPHRDLLADLACLGVPFIAPVAKQAYFECRALAAKAPPSFDRAMQLFEVEDPRVGMALLRGLKQGRTGLIYVDGNMGPDGHKVQEGAVEVDFLGLKIRVKAGIARLARSMKLPILPVMTRLSPGGPCLRYGAWIDAHADSLECARARGDETSVMQALYDELAREVAADPAQWEFAFCLHRWRQSADSAAAVASGEPSAATGFRIAPQDVALLDREDGLYWVDVRRQKAYRIPAFARGWYERLSGSEPQPEPQARAWLEGQGAEPGQARDLIEELSALGVLARQGRGAVSPGAARN